MNADRKWLPAFKYFFQVSDEVPFPYRIRNQKHDPQVGCNQVDGRVMASGKDRYDQVLCDVLVDGSSLNRDLLAAGLAWLYKRYNDDHNRASIKFA